MKLGRRTALTLAAVGAAFPLPPSPQEGGLRIVVPFGAGSGTDNTMRVFAEAFRTATGRTVMVDDKPGGGTTIGTLEVSRAKPDGNTVLYTTGGHTTNAVLMRKLPYDPIEGFTPITLLTRSQGFGLMVSGNSRFKTMDDYPGGGARRAGQDHLRLVGHRQHHARGRRAVLPQRPGPAHRTCPTRARRSTMRWRAQSIRSSSRRR